MAGGRKGKKRQELDDDVDDSASSTSTETGRSARLTEMEITLKLKQIELDFKRTEAEAKRSEEETKRVQLQVEADAKRAEAEADAKRAEAEVRKAEIDVKRAEAEADTKRAEAEVKKAEIEAEAEIRRRGIAAENEVHLKELECQENERERRARVELETLRLSRETTVAASGSSTSTQTTVSAKFTPPIFSDANDIDAYFRVFEQCCHREDVPQSEWTRYISKALSGKAFQELSKLTLEESQDYEKVKQFILKKYKRTADYYREEFRNRRQGKEEMFNEHCNAVAEDFDRWMSGLEVNEEYDKVRQAMIIDQVLSHCSTQEKEWLLGKKISTLEDLKESGNHYQHVYGRKMESNPKEKHGGDDDDLENSSDERREQSTYKGSRFYCT